jgi:hypothetical protein
VNDFLEEILIAFDSDNSGIGISELFDGGIGISEN